VIIIGRRIRIPLGELRLRYARSSGPGGQNVNKVSSKVILRWPVVASPSLPEDVRQRFLGRYRRRITRAGELVISSQRHREQGANRDDCLAKLRAMLTEVATPPRPRKPTRPGRSAHERRLKSKRTLSDKKRRRQKVRSED
jgi:ribosome-associated protein